MIPPQGFPYAAAPAAIPGPDGFYYPVAPVPYATFPPPPAPATAEPNLEVTQELRNMLGVSPNKKDQQRSAGHSQSHGHGKGQGYDIDVTSTRELRALLGLPGASDAVQADNASKDSSLPAVATTTTAAAATSTLPTPQHGVSGQGREIDNGTNS